MAWEKMTKEELEKKFAGKSTAVVMVCQALGFNAEDGLKLLLFVSGTIMATFDLEKDIPTKISMEEAIAHLKNCYEVAHEQFKKAKEDIKKEEEDFIAKISDIANIN